MPQGRRSFLKTAVFSVIPAAVLFLGAEAIVRLLTLDRPSVWGGGFGGLGAQTFDRVDEELGWSMKPGYRGFAWDKSYVTTNDLGLRSAEVPSSKGNEFRVLSLGESSTFGIGVADDQTYSARLEKILNGAGPARPVRVINAGVSGYSSTQSLLYLERRGLALRPDMVLFYHEMNDYLPATIRDVRVEGPEVMMTDRELIRSRLNRAGRFFLARSALYRFLAHAWADWRVKRFAREKIDYDTTANFPLGEIGFPRIMPYMKIGAPVAVDRDGRQRSYKEVYPALLGRRVSERELRGNLEELRRLCAGRGVRLVIIHPTYRPSRRHECLLTRFCRDEGVPMFEAFDGLHPGGNVSSDNPMFYDFTHPSALGHERLAAGLADFIRATFGRI